MKEVNLKLGNLQFTEAGEVNEDPYIIGSFGAEGTGKTRLAVTAPEVVGFVALERKSYHTVDTIARELGRRVWKPKNPEELIINPRKVAVLSAPANNTPKAIEEAHQAIRKHYRDHVTRVYDTVYAMAEHPDVRTIVIDTFGQLCQQIDAALYGFQDKFIRVEGQLYKDRKEYNQEIIDFLNSLTPFRKHILLIHKHKDEYTKKGPTGRMVWEGFKFLGNHTNVLVHHESNKIWDANSEDDEKQWHWALSVRTCQRNPNLEGPDGYRMLRDDMITYQNLIMMIDPDTDPDTL